MSAHLIHPAEGGLPIAVTPQSMGWSSLGFEVRRLRAGEGLTLHTGGREFAFVPLAGELHVRVGASAFALSRQGAFRDPASVLYVPPGEEVHLQAGHAAEFALGSAPATGVHPVRLITAPEIPVELRGGGTARRQVNHLLAPPLPAERLIVYEVYVPAGAWAGWPPHRHDGVNGSPYLEEIYFFRFDRPGGFGFHRNYDPAPGGLDEAFTVSEDDCVAVPGGFHVTGATPGHNMWILNVLAGDLFGDERATPPAFDPAELWIRENWTGHELPLPAPWTSGGRP